MTSEGFRFDRFTLVPADRRLRLDDIPIELNARYLDALMLLVSEAGKLVSKDRFLEDVWSGVPVTDEALTQCIKTLRRQLGDDAAHPRFIETVPKHGYRFIAPVERIVDDAPARSSGGDKAPANKLRRFLLLGGAGTLGAGVAGLVGGLFYGFVAASQPLGAGMGGASVLMVILWLTLAAAVMGGAGVSFGIAAAGLVSRPSWTSIVGGAAGGLVVGGVVKLLGLDAFNLLLGRSPGAITGGAEGVLLGGATGLGAWLGVRGERPRSLRRMIAVAGLAGGAMGVLITLAGGRLMGGSLDLLAHSFPHSRLRIDPVGGLFGENGWGPISQVVTGGLEGMLFAGCIVGAMIVARRTLDGEA